MNRGLWRYFGFHDTVRIAHANFIASVACGTIALSTFPPPFPRSVIIIDFLVCLLLSIGVRAGMRLLLEVASAFGGAALPRALIYGGGSGGSILLSEARSNTALRRSICGFIDDDPNKQGMSVNGVAVVGTGAQLSRLCLTSNRTFVIGSADWHFTPRSVTFRTDSASVRSFNGTLPTSSTMR